MKKEIYKQPSVKVVRIENAALICDSPSNQSMYEEDLGDGGFSSKSIYEKYKMDHDDD